MEISSASPGNAAAQPRQSSGNNDTQAKADNAASTSSSKTNAAQASAAGAGTTTQKQFKIGGEIVSQQVYKQYDLDGNNKISASELAAYRQATNQASPTEQQASRPAEQAQSSDPLGGLINERA